MRFRRQREIILLTNVVGRCGGNTAIQAFPGASEDLIKNINGVAPVAELDGDEIGFLVAKVAKIKNKDSIESCDDSAIQLWATVLVVRR